MSTDSASSGDDFLQVMATASTARLDAARANIDVATIAAQATARPAPPPLQLSGAGFDLIAEVKKRSPSAGRLAADALSPVDQASRYAQAGAAAISVLTEPSRFDGSLDDLQQVVDALPAVPVMRKDFLVDPYQVFEARAAGAGGVLLIAAMLTPEQLRHMLQTTFSLGMFALVEAFDTQDLEHCVPVLEEFLPAVDDHGHCRLLLGINCRNLRTLDVEFERFFPVLKQLPTSLPRVAESGVDSMERAERVAAAGYELALVGTALMRSEDPGQAAAELIQAGRTAADGV